MNPVLYGFLLVVGMVIVGAIIVGVTFLFGYFLVYLGFPV
jgi:hypothetical protein